MLVDVLMLGDGFFCVFDLEKGDVLFVFVGKG